MRHDDAALARRPRVDGVVADAEARDDLQRRQARDQGSLHGGLCAGGEAPDARADLLEERLGVRSQIQAMQGEARLDRRHHAGMHRLEHQDVDGLHGRGSRRKRLAGTSEFGRAADPGSFKPGIGSGPVSRPGAAL